MYNKEDLKEISDTVVKWIIIVEIISQVIHHSINFVI